MGKWQRSLYQPVLPLGKDGKRVTGSAEHIALSRKAAGEGMVLVKNENETLPLAKGTKVALFGKGTIDYVKGGGGSGDVTVEYIRNFYEGMKIKEAKGEVSLFHELPEFYEKNVKEQYAAGAVPGMTREPEVPDELVQKKHIPIPQSSPSAASPARAGTANARSPRKAMSCLRMRKNRSS